MPFELLYLWLPAVYLSYRLLRPCKPLAEDDTTWHGVLLFALGYLALQLAIPTLLPLFIPGGINTENYYADLIPMLSLQATATAAAAAIILIMARTLPLGMEGHAGLRPHRGSFAVVIAFATWIAWAPVMMLAAALNGAIIEVLNFDVADSQLIIQAFRADSEARESVVVWLSAALVVPIGEEILFRGALHGGLRRWMPPSVAAAVSGFTFGAMHDAAAMLPVAALGFLLAMLYERTRSLTAPILVHVIHNTVQLVILTTAPEMLTP